MLTMKVIIIGAIISALLLLAASPVAFGSSSPVPLPTADDAVLDMVVTSCDDLAATDLYGVVGLLDVLDCDKPVTLRISKESDVVIVGQDSIVMRNVLIAVGPGAQLGLISGGTIRMTRDEALGWNDPLLSIEGDVFYEVGGRSRGDPATQQGVMTVFPSGSLTYYEGSYSYPGRNSFSVVSSGDVLGGSNEGPPRSSVRAVGEAHEEIRSCDDLAQLIKDNKEIIGTLSFVGPIVCSTPQTVRISGKATIVSDDNLVTKNVHVVVDSGAELALFAKKAIRLLRDEGSDKSLMTLKGDLFLKAGGTIPEESDAQKASAFVVLNGGSLFSKEGVFTVEQHAIKLFADTSLKAGESVRTRIVSADGRTAIWPTVDGSIVFGLVDSKDAASESAILVAADERRQRKVRTIRRFLREERESAGTAAKGEKEVTRGWFARDPRRRHKADIDTARAHEGEVAMSLDDRGCVKVTVDGVCVLSKSGKYRWEWLNRFPWRRRRSSRYEVSATPDGMEVTLGDKLIWGATVEVD